MEETQLLREFNKLTDNKFDYIRLSVVNFDIFKNTAEYVFLYPESKYSTVQDNLGAIKGHLAQLLTSQFKTSILLNQSHLDIDFFKAQLLKIFKANAVLSAFVNFDSIEVAILNEGEVALTISVQDVVYSYVQQSSMLNEVKKYLYYLYTHKFDLKFKSIETTVQQKKLMEENANKKSIAIEKVLEDDTRERGIVPSNIRHFLGKEIDTNLASLIEDSSVPLDDVVLCGTLTEFVEMTSKNKQKKFYKFVLQDFTSSIKGAIFATKASAELLPQLKVGDVILGRGKVELDKFAGGSAVQFYPKDISFCDLPKDFKLNRIVSKVLEHYVYVEPKPFVEIARPKYVEVNFFDDAPSFFDDPNQISCFSDNGFCKSDTVESTIKTSIDSYSKVPNGNDSILADDNVSSMDSVEYVVFDVETTGLDEKSCTIIELAAVKIVRGKIVETFDTLIDPNVELPLNIVELTGICDDMLKGKPTLQQVLPDFFKFCHSTTLVAHNIEFDYRFLSHHSKSINIYFDNPKVDTLMLARNKLRGLKNYKLGTVCEHLEIVNDSAHRALSDTIATAKAFLKLKD